VITVRVRYVGILAAYAGGKQHDVDLPEGATVDQLLLRLAEAGSESLRSILLPEGKLGSLVRIVRNHAQIEGPGMGLPLADGDELLILTHIAGGCRPNSPGG
jgi:molybdopterin converting factor small subunit